MGKKIVITASAAAVFLLVSLGVFLNVYHSAMAQKNDGHEEAIDRALKETDLKNAESVETFNGLKQFYVITGLNKSNKAVYVWVPENKKEKPVLKLASDGITEKKALEIVKAQQNPVKVISVKLGMEKNVPLWEVKYIDDQNRYTYDLINFSNGEIRKHIAIKK
ncbi:DUF5590 domain-containing protein [Metabacillus idriensis]|uniref:Peptidase n=1 Tax=Metabacillus idriensis TaxID=324768 RepID=A0A6I2MC04_9BACI|nr:DUF5590 domain-containing protein [Metabacillus idriensis]MCM3596915.1 DUF5590 domain-containing protein [Metabacillus idriensis]MRX55738.1 hypothetical protein [Metabacillus idriensis]OHR74554.1 hypothetical protein HMPREF3291_17420 [Bacillus sp. HMSC76G11]